MKCPECNSTNTIKNGSVRAKPKGECKECGREFTLNPTKKSISQETWELVDKLLLEKIPITGIARVTGISEQWLQEYVNRKYKAIPHKVKVKKKRKMPSDDTM
jgi:transposase-like protein